ncbi:MAG: homoserine O-acetyltransferase [Gemmatimonadota bacterium]
MTSRTVPSTGAQDFSLGDFRTSQEEVLPGAKLRYRVFGDPAVGKRDGWVLLFHALTGSHNADQWWGPMIGPGKPLDPAVHPILSANLLGSCYGSSSPAPGSGRAPGAFPDLTPRDLALAHAPLLQHLGIDHLVLAAGGSLGGMVALEWARGATVPTDTVIVFAAPAATSAQAIGWNAAQRMAIEADPGWKGGHYAPGAGPTAGLATARAIAMITYRSAVEFSSRFGRASTRAQGFFDVEAYLRVQGEKLIARFDAASYIALMRAMDLHDMGGLAEAGRASAERIKRIIGVGIDTDILYYPAEVAEWVNEYRSAGLDASYREIKSMYGHDAFLIEWDQVEAILREGLGLTR